MANSYESIRGVTFWVCHCDCGKEVRVRYGNLKSGNTQSCGCLFLDRVTIHGESQTREYHIWRGILGRCFDERHHSFSGYGGRGITVCKRWLVYANFLADMGRAPSSEHSIDRKDNNRLYSKNNCRWATRSEQMANTRTNRWVTFNGETRTLTQWAVFTGLRKSTIRERLQRGWPVARVLTEIPIHRGNNG